MFFRFSFLQVAAPVLAPIPTYTVRFSQAEDYDRVVEFYTKNYHENVCNRKEDLMRRLEANGSNILIEDKAGNIVGSSLAYPLSGAGHPSQWIELGSTRMILNGYEGLFDIMVALQALRTFAAEPPQDLFAVQTESIRVRDKFNALGFRDFTPPAGLVQASDNTLKAYNGTCGFEKWAAAGVEALPVMAQRLIEAIDRPYLTNPKTGDRICIDLSQITSFKEFEKDIRALATTKIGDPDAPDHSRKMVHVRENWMRQRFK